MADEASVRAGHEEDRLCGQSRIVEGRMISTKRQGRVAYWDQSYLHLTPSSMRVLLLNLSAVGGVGKLMVDAVPPVSKGRKINKTSRIVKDLIEGREKRAVFGLCRPLLRRHRGGAVPLRAALKKKLR